MSRLTAVIQRDVTHKQCFNCSDSSTVLCVVCAAVIGGGENRPVDRGSGKGAGGNCVMRGLMICV